MQTKKCTMCKVFKPINSFYKIKNGMYGVKSECKKCEIKKAIKYGRTKDGFVSVVYNRQKTNSKKRGHNPPNYTLSELGDWLFSQELFHKLFKQWEGKLYDKDFTPSCDRTDDSRGYDLSRMQLMTFKENWEKGMNDIRSGKIIHGCNPQVAVIGTDMTNGKETVYVSFMEAQRQTGAYHSNIQLVCDGKRNYCNGNYWKYA